MKPAAMKLARKRANVTLEQLSGDVGLSVSQLSRFESGHRVPRVPEMQRIARRLGVTVEELCGQPPPAQPQPEPLGLNDEQTRVVRLVFQAFLQYAASNPVLKDRLTDPAYQAALSRIAAQYAQAPRVHEAVQTDGEAALKSILLALEMQPGR